jgi:ABC-type phosphate transport system substrate-binding protein
LRKVHPGWLALLIVLCSTFAGARDVALIANKSNRLEALSQSELMKICKGQSQHWPDGKPVTLITRDPATPEMKLVVEKIYAMPKDEVASLIANANHNRMNHPAILVVDSDEELIKKVANTPGAVGLVDVYAITGSVKVLRIGDKLPLQPGYLLHGN